MTNCEIITIGDELLIGQVINSNTAWIAKKLSLAGINICRMTTVGDNEDDILKALTDAKSYAEIVIVTGGLGPTNDDITKKCACKLYNCDLVFNDEMYENVVTRFHKLHYTLTDVNRSQALVPAKCIPLLNSCGTAPGMLFEEAGKMVVFLPGVPREMECLMTQQVMPRVTKKYKLSGIYYRTLMTQGLGESFVAERIQEWENNLPENIKLAYLPNYGSVKLRITAFGDDYDANKKTVDNELVCLETLIPDIVYGYDDETLEVVVGKMLKTRNLTISTAESCTGGYLSHLITMVAGSSDYYKGSIISYSNEVKINTLKVSAKTIEQYGAVSEQTVCEMVKGVISILNTDIGIAVSGIAGPGGGTTDKPVGTVWLAVAYHKNITCKLLHLGNTRDINIKRAALSALKMVYDILQNI